MASCVAAAPPKSGRSASASPVEFRVTLRDIPAEWKQEAPLIESNILAAARAWGDLLDARPCTIDIVFRADPAAHLGSGRSVTTAPLAGEKHEGRQLYEQGWAAEMRTGNDPNGDQPDVEIILQPDYMRTLWWDPRPDQRTDRVPGDKLDAVTVLTHELGHALAFNGWINPVTGAADAQSASTYDRRVTYDGKDFFFTGPTAVKLWGGPVPLAKTRNNYHHVCDVAAGPQARLKDALMNGITFEYGRRYEISSMDLAIVADCGVPLRGPKPPR